MLDPMKLKMLEEMMVFFGAMGGLASATGVAMVWIKHRGRRAGDALDLAPHLAEIASRLDRLDSSVDTMAIEVERISEGQRFVSKLLADRPGSAPLAERRLPGTTTPH